MVENLKLSKKLATFLVYSTLSISIIIIAIFLNIIYKLKSASVVFIIDYRLISFFIIFLMVILNISTYIFINKNVIKRLTVMKKNINESSSLEEKNIINLEDDEINCIYDKVNALSNEANVTKKKLINTINNLKEEEKNYSNILNAMSNAFFSLKAIVNDKGEYIDGEITDVNLAGMELLGLSRKEIINNRFSNLYKNFYRDEKEIIQIFKRIKKSKSECIAREINIIDDKWGLVSVYSLSDGYFSIIINNITEIKKYEKNMTYLTNYDTLTNLLNRNNLLEYLMELTNLSKEFSIYFIDLDNFKNINDTVGHNTGDEVLRIVSDRLTQLSSNNITVGRLGGDEFIIVEKGNSDSESIRKLADKILNLLNKKIQINRYSFNLKASIGISHYPKHSRDVFTLLKYADISMYKGKQDGGNTAKIFSKDMVEEIELENKLITALDNNEFEVYYQPIYNVKQEKVVGAEALIRWIMSNEIISPIKFIPLAKKNGEIIRIDEFVLKEACKYCEKMIDLGEKDFKISVNVSLLALKQEDFIEKTLQILNQFNITPKSIKLEITEDEIIDNTEFVIDVLNNLRKLGFKISLDDFGVGYSSFNYIKMLPLDTIKIDRSLLISVETDKKTLAIIETLIKLSHTLDLDVVCEGVEIKSQMDLLKDINCDKIQGFYISKPLNSKDFEDFVVRFNNININNKEVATTL